MAACSACTCNKREDIKSAGAGDIVALVGMKLASTGDTICDEKRPVVLESLDIPEPVIEVAIEPKTKTDRDALSAALNKLAKEDPSFRVKGNEETGQTLIAGMGELHLDIIVDRLVREFNVNANVGKPQVAYRETITKPSKSDLKYAKQSGGRGQYGHCVIEVEPNPEKGYEFVNAITGGVIPKEYIPSIDKGIQDALKSGVLAGFPVVDVKVTLVFGSYHEVDSSEQAFYVAGSMAIKDAMQKATPALLEPYMDVEVVTPDDYLGDVMGDLNGRRGRVQSMEAAPVLRLSALRFRCPKCSAMPRICVPVRRAARPSRCSSTTMKRCLRLSLKKSARRLRTKPYMIRCASGGKGGMMPPLTPSARSFENKHPGRFPSGVFCFQRPLSLDGRSFFAATGHLFFARHRLFWGAVMGYGCLISTG